MTSKLYALRRIVSGKTKRSVELAERAVCFRDAIRLAETPIRAAQLEADLTDVENELASTRRIIATAERNILASQCADTDCGSNTLSEYRRFVALEGE